MARNNVAYAGFWLRFAAAIIDGIILIIIRHILAWLVSLELALILSGIIGWFYFALLESSDKQATLGKSIMGIIVTDLEGNKISFGKATARYWAKLLSALILFIGFIMAGFTEKKQALHDIIAGTLVIRRS